MCNYTTVVSKSFTWSVSQWECIMSLCLRFAGDARPNSKFCQIKMSKNTLISTTASKDARNYIIIYFRLVGYIVTCTVYIYANMKGGDPRILIHVQSTHSLALRCITMEYVPLVYYYLDSTASMSAKVWEDRKGTERLQWPCPAADSRCFDKECKLESTVYVLCNVHKL